MTDLLPEVVALLAEHSPAEPEDITPDKHLISDLALDSFSLLDAVSSFEEHFDISVPDKDIRLLSTVQDVVDYLEENIEE